MSGVDMAMATIKVVFQVVFLAAVATLCSVPVPCDFMPTYTHSLIKPAILQMTPV